MAGDWIKLEHATPNKPEIYRLSRMLGCSRGDAFLLAVEWWVWLDRNSCNGNVTLLKRQDCDELMHCPGFAAAMEAVGWLKFDGEDALNVVNFSRHNGKTAKERALTNGRVKRLRNAHGNENVTVKPLPEKRRSKDLKDAAETPSAAIATDPKKRLFDLGVTLLTAHGTSESSARSFLALQCKNGEGGEGRLSELLGYLAANPKVEPRSYIAAAMKPPDPAAAMRRKLELMP